MKNLLKAKRKYVILAVVALFSITAVLVFVAANHQNRVSTAPLGNSQQPGYTTLLPTNKTVSELGGWQRVSPNDAEPVYAYSDSIDGTAITVSQQPLPASFKDAPNDTLRELAKAYSATEELTVDGVTVFVGTSSKGPQSVLFIKSNLLVLIKSQKEITPTLWSSYVQSLR